MAAPLKTSEKKLLLWIARQAIRRKSNLFDGFTTTEPLRALMPTFVTITQDQELRGCIGSLTATRPLYRSVMENAYQAAYSDPRFEAVSAEEISLLRIEISILSPLQPFQLAPSKLLEYLNRSKPGVLIQYDRAQATFLPQVWSHFESADLFLAHLCLKAGLHPETWMKSGVKIWTYTVEKIEE